jgi:endoglucanase
MRKSLAVVGLLWFASGLACQSAPPPAPVVPPAPPPPPLVYPPDQAVPVGLLHVAGQQLLDGSNRPILLRGVAFGNQVWQDVADPRKHHAEADYARIAALHMNAVRFYLHDVTFEDPATPGQYKPLGFAWLDDNVAWAKKHGIYLILNLHVPPGGYQSLGKGTGLWESPDAQQHFVVLWKAIAARYRSEATIAGYDLLNEPAVTHSIDQWKELAEKTIRAIREVDPNHALFVERVNAVGNDWNENAERNFFLVNDPNVVYEFHFYKPIDFTHQGAHWVDFAAEDARYPDPERVGLEWFNADYRATFSRSPTVAKGESGWKFYRGEPVTVNDPSLMIGKPVLACARNSGKVWFDDLSIEQLDKNGRLTQKVWQLNLQTRRGWHFWAKDGVGMVASETPGHADDHSVSIASTTAEANLSSDYFQFRLEQGATYRITGWMKGQAVPATAECQIRLDFYSARAPIFAWDRAFLAYELDAYVAWGKKHQVPLFLGEFGLIRQAFEANRGGLVWTSDMLDLLKERQLHFTFHDYHEVHMGVFYGDDTLPDPANANQALLDLFREKLSAH